MEQIVPGYNDLPIEATTQISNVSAVIKKPYDPDVIPQDIWRTWVNTVTWDRRVSNWSTAVADWISSDSGWWSTDIVWWSTDLVFSATDSDTVARSWPTGPSWSIKLWDGTSYSVNSGNTGNISWITYIYHDGTSTLKTTTTPQDAVGTGKIMVCVSKNSTSPAKAQFQAFWTLWQSVFITADNIAANTITANQLAANSIDGMTITWATIRTASSGERIQMNWNTLTWYNSSNTKKIEFWIYWERIFFYTDAWTDSGSLASIWSDMDLRATTTMQIYWWDTIYMAGTNWIDMDSNVRMIWKLKIPVWTNLY